MLKKTRSKPARKFIFSTCVNLERVGFDVGNFLCSSEVKIFLWGERLSGQFKSEKFAPSTYKIVYFKIARISFLQYKQKCSHTNFPLKSPLKKLFMLCSR